MQTSIKQKAYSYFQRGNMKKARELYNKALAQNKQDPEILYMLGSICANLALHDAAISYFQQCLKLQPGTFIALCGLAAAYNLAGNPSKALETYLQANDLKPGNPDVAIHLANILKADKKLEEAETILRKAQTLHPENPDILHCLGEIFHMSRNLDAAQRYYKQALSIQSGRPETHNRLGYLYNTQGFYRKAIDCYKSAIGLEPTFIEAHINLSSCYINCGELNLSIVTAKKALSLSPKNTNALLNIAAAYEKMGDVKAAYDVIQPLLKKNIKNCGIAQVYLSLCNKLNEYDSAISYADAVMSSSGLPKTAMERLLFSAGLASDKNKKFDSAFEYFEKANDLRPDRFRPGEFSTYMNSIRQVFDWDFMHKPHAIGIDDSLPIMIVGMPRSGSSLTEQILDSHPSIYGAGELSDIGEIATKLSNHIDANKGFPYALKDINSEALHYYSELYINKLKELSNGEEFVTDKMPQNFIHLGLISILLPKVKIIHCRRHPLDICMSIYFQDFNESHDYSTKLENIAYYYVEYERLMNHWKMVLDTPILDLHYSELVSNPEENIRMLLDFVNVEWDEKCLQFHKSKRHVPTASYNQVTQKMYTSSLGKWKNYESHLQPLINKFESLGFDLSKYS